jgi:hypothetical protein
MELQLLKCILQKRRCGWYLSDTEQEGEVGFFEGGNEILAFIRGRKFLE